MSALPQPVEPEHGGYEETLPAELSAAVDAAARRAEALAAAGRELNFVEDGGELRVEVRDRQGNVLRVVSPSQAVAIMSGLGQI